jgi:lipid-A-disaccharide synthase
LPGQTVVIVAGEASGDMHASRLARELLKLNPELKLEGMGGQNMRRAGVDILVDNAELAVVGLVEVLANYRTIKAALDKLKQHVKQARPDLLILVDYQEFNQKLAAFAKSIGIKVLFYIGPQVWAWRPKRVYKMGQIVDQMAVIFPFEVDLYQHANVPVEFTGHPLVDEVVNDKTPAQARELLDLGQQTTVGMFPGSRKGEVKRLMPIMLKTAKILQAKNPGIQFVLPLAESLDEAILDPYLYEIMDLNINVVRGQAYDVMQACDAIITASGTATLEIALMGIPMAIIYRVSPISYNILRFIVKLDYIGLANIVAGKSIVQEFLQGKAKPKLIAAEIQRILNDSDYNTTIRNELSQVRNKLGDKSGSVHIAQLAYDMLNNNS